MTAMASDAARTRRYHGLDGLRGFAMLLGIALHATLPYFSRLIGFEADWPADDDQSALLFLVFDFIHTWRMPTFFLLAGFFAHLVLARRADPVFVLDRLKRIGLPLLLFGAVMSVVVPLVWVYGWKGELSPDTLWGVLDDRVDLDSSGDLVAHLWFLYYLLLMYAALVACRRLAATWRSRVGAPSDGWRGLAMQSADAVYTRVPLLLALAAFALLVVRGGDESKPVWPLNAPDLLYGMLFFLYGYGLYARRELIERLRGTWTLVGLWSLAAVVYVGHLWLLGAADEAAKAGADEGAVGALWLAGSLFYGACAATFSVGFVGLFERLLTSPRGWIRWLADSSYWIYVMHLPVVAFLTFWLAHLDRQGRLEQLTGFGWSAELKFGVACAATGALGVATYRYLVRYTPLGTLLNGKRTRGAG